MGLLDGDASSGKALDKGASAASMETEFTSGLYETAKSPVDPLGKDKASATSAFSKDGAIGSAFTTSGALGGTAQSIGGPFDKDGSIGKHFKPEGSIGSSVQEHLGKADTTSQK